MIIKHYLRSALYAPPPSLSPSSSPLPSPFPALTNLRPRQAHRAHGQSSSQAGRSDFLAHGARQAVHHHRHLEGEERGRGGGWEGGREG